MYIVSIYMYTYVHTHTHTLGVGGSPKGVGRGGVGWDGVGWGGAQQRPCNLRGSGCYVDATLMLR